MIRVSTVSLALLASPVAAQDWFTTLIVDKGPRYALSGTLNSIFPANGTDDYMSSEAFADGVDARSADCASANYFEIDYFFGRDRAFGGHILFGLDTSGAVPQPVEPALFYDEMNQRDDVVRSYAAFESVSIRVDSFECVDGVPVLKIGYKGEVFLEFGEGQEQLLVTGTASADMKLRDMNDY